ncbi:uncharacterized protein ZC3H3 [Centruroides vittatus]|uniref:uncharacterized protein ZC3H3 n=1 Tax=Centruroides vittatus TaxID=120091 RepID=UPI00350F9B30
MSGKMENQKLINEIQYLSRLIDNHKSQAANTQYRQSGKFSKLCTSNIHPSNFRRNPNLQVNKLQNNKRHVHSGILKINTNPYKIDRTIYNSLPKRTFALPNSSSVEQKTLMSKTNQQVSSVVKSEYKSSKLQDLIQCSPIIVTIQDQSKSISVGYPSDKVKVFKNDTKELPNISVTKSTNRLLQIKAIPKLPEKKNLSISSNRLFENKMPNNLPQTRKVPADGTNRLQMNTPTTLPETNTVSVTANKLLQNVQNKLIEKNNSLGNCNKLYMLNKSFNSRSKKAILKTKYKVVNKKPDKINSINWKQTLKGKQKKNMTYQKRNYVSSPWKLVYRNQPRVSGKHPKSLSWINHHWRNPYYNVHKNYIKRNTLPSKKLRKQFLASRRRKYTGKIAQQLKKNPLLKSRMVMIGGLLYNVSKTKLSRACKSSQNKPVSRNQAKHQTLLICGIRYRMDRSGKVLKRLPIQPSHIESQVTTPRKNLKRIDLGGDTYIQTKPGILTKTSSSQARTFVNRVVNRSIYHMLAADQKKSHSKNNLYCMFYNRFGRCNKGELCPYKHDADKIAVCTRFLRGTCKVVDCPFSHKVAPEKMPVCSFYLQGRCNSDNCPYRHVKVNRKAEVCKDFLRGYCPVGQKCKKTHTLVCPDYLHNGSCKNGDKCPMKHSTKRGQKRKLDESETQPTKKILVENKEESNPGPSFIRSRESGKAHPAEPLSEQPSFISLGSYEEESDSQTKIIPIGNPTPLRIRPLFLKQGTLGKSSPGVPGK